MNGFELLTGVFGESAQFELCKMLVPGLIAFLTCGSLFTFSSLEFEAKLSIFSRHKTIKGNQTKENDSMVFEKLQERHTIELKNKFEVRNKLNDRTSRNQDK
ncbi:hypothetical protein HELRODRAFT_166968 [Helobdella robusta]|uniref:Uncharacterized protein n=1 Tax=Helobdella robusta TaxID=6412 RepID=T1EYT8_HELRO|nr:hypothetical protein HELRODRAFT_166968 [Helobdella robusta]ESO11882.1 hypothetical protein HELRODRAFT_166968 [Helobdella robusta]